MICGLRRLKMKKVSGIAAIAGLFVFLVLRRVSVENPLAAMMISNPLFRNSADYLHWRSEAAPPTARLREAPSTPLVISTQDIVSRLFAKQNFSEEEQRSLQTWNRFRNLANRAQGLPNAMEAVKEATAAWGSLVGEILRDKEREAAANTTQKTKANKCPYSIRRMDAGELLGAGGFKLRIPCGLVQGSSVTVIGTPAGILGDFRIDLIGDVLPGDPEPPIILHLNVRLMGDKRTDDPVIVQNTWTKAGDWGAEERCPSPAGDDKKVDDLETCSGAVGQDEKTMAIPRNVSAAAAASKRGPFFPFRMGRLAIITFHVGLEGIQMTVDGKHITSFAFRQSLEPWLVSQVRISGDFKAIALLAGGLPTSEDSEHVADLHALKSTPLTPHKPLTMFVGVVSTANNFKRRMAVRRSWMQYDAVKSGQAAVRFFVGLHKNEMVNEELWSEARSYGDVQLMPFVDYYSLIAWKSIAICIFGTDVVSAEYVMKADDDSFVRVDEVLSSLRRANVSRGLLYGRMNADSEPSRDADSKWYITPEVKEDPLSLSLSLSLPLSPSYLAALGVKEWPEEKYPPWANGPGYVVSRDVAEFVHSRHRSGRLKMFKLEDVAMGMWVADMAKGGAAVRYVDEERVCAGGCEPGYVVAHYQGPRDMLCLWRALKETGRPTCCAKR